MIEILRILNIFIASGVSGFYFSLFLSVLADKKLIQKGLEETRKMMLYLFFTLGASTLMLVIVYAIITNEILDPETKNIVVNIRLLISNLLFAYVGYLIHKIRKSI